ncbi:pentapeptide repeat-containing protein [Actinomadura alba]|uniref:Pentapeptide repeat-containing protein n=1 Tax=Actinomadura alba TaxID=406431 RepID=A0ABR7LH25_9ACTN|nr:pentapeptide repeat-containing protein [Actinomadura alba]MBC6464081.1 pentapeptide repeat-containing protein [Actinomadura alba]
MSPRDPETHPDGDFSGQEFTDVDFRGTVFPDRTDFGGAVFHGKADFSGAVFTGRVFFTGAVFEGEADFYQAVFEGFANFRGVRIVGAATFNGAVFADGPLIEDAVVDGPLGFRRAVFENTSMLGPLSARSVDFTHATCHRRVRIDVRTEEVGCERARFPSGVRLLAHGARVFFTDTELGGASFIGTQDPDDRDDWPQVMSLTGTDTGELTLSYTRLWRCRLAGVHNLDRMRIEGYSTFDVAPPRLFTARRSIIWDEHLLRGTWPQAPRLGRRRWAPPADLPPAAAPESASEVEQAYRALRKGCVDAGDEVGAGDFYYGEMEMRRLGQFLLARTRRRDRWWPGWVAARGEHLLLWLYWAVSGYGLRASRAFAALAVVIAVAAAAFGAWGYPPAADMTYFDSLRFSLRAATSLLRGPEQGLTPAGEWIELVLRFTGPLLFGLALLAVRGRVRR